MGPESRRTIISPLSVKIDQIMASDSGLADRLQRTGRVLVRYPRLIKALVIDVDPHRKQMFDVALSASAVSMVGLYEILGSFGLVPAGFSGVLPSALVGGCVDKETKWKNEYNRAQQEHIRAEEERSRSRAERNDRAWGRRNRDPNYTPSAGDDPYGQRHWRK